MNITGSFKVFLFLGLLHMIVFFSSEVAARTPADVSSEQEDGKPYSEVNQHGLDQNGPQPKPYDPQPKPYDPSPSPRRRQGCLYGCCRFYTGGCVCCRRADQALQARQPQSKPHD